MAPATTELIEQTSSALSVKASSLQARAAEVIDANFKRFDVTPNIGTELDRSIQLKDLLNAPNSDDLLRALAVLVSQRNVVFLRNQDLTKEQQKNLVNKLATLAGRPVQNGLHVHPVIDSAEGDDEVQVITSDYRQTYQNVYNRSELASTGWHSDVTFESSPSDYALLKIHTLPESGGDTLWASGYEVYDRLSPAFRVFLEGLTATHGAPQFKEIAKIKGQGIRTNRGSPDNQGEELESVHPVIRTHPVTGWKVVFVNPVFTIKINELSNDESRAVLDYLYTLISQNHDLQVRYKWGKNDVAIWDNRTAYHTATTDFTLAERRVGDRAISVGEKPYYDPASKSRREALGIEPTLGLRHLIKA
ncbi:hypothetical protein HK101_008467 [Irineochytrium annulatum]|nr:hypothetical protein HK101_008467 [Irineochytrium annulatum]